MAPRPLTVTLEVESDAPLHAIRAYFRRSPFVLADGTQIRVRQVQSVAVVQAVRPATGRPHRRPAA